MSTAKEMIEMLRAHYIAPSKPAGGYFCPELTAPEGNRRADLIWLPLTSYQRGEIIGHEVKVSRSDVIQELSDPTKADAWLRHCTQWWLVVSDPKLIEGLSIPEQWGVLAPPSGRARRTMTVIKDAPKLKPVDQAMALATIMSRLFYGGDDAAARLAFVTKQVEYSEERRRAAEEARRRVEDQLREVRTSPRDAEQIKAVLNALDKIDRKGDYRYLTHEPATIAAGIADHTVLRRKSEQLAHRVRQRVQEFERALEPVNVSQVLDGLLALERAIQADLATPALDGLEDVS